MKEKYSIKNNFTALKEGDRKVFEEIYETYYEKLCQFLLNYTNDKSKIEDIVQNTFIKLWDKRQEIYITTSFKSYLYRSAYNGMMDTYRRKKKKDNLLSDYYFTALMRAENQDEDYKKRQRKKLKACLEKLPSRCRKIFAACKLSKRNNQEVAAEFGISLKTVEGHITKGFKMLKECTHN